MKMGWAFIAVLLSGCMTTTGSGEVRRTLLTFQQMDPPPKTGWKKVVTPEYELITDLDLQLTQRAAQQLSQAISGLKAMFGRAPIAVERKITVIAMADTMEFERRFGKKNVGFAVTTWDEIFICVFGPPDRWFFRNAQVGFDTAGAEVVHSLAHAMLHRYFPNQTKWFTEGLALYLETYHWLDAETLRLGDLNVYAYGAYREVRTINVEDMLEWKSTDQQREMQLAGLNGMSWAFVFYARNQESKTFAQFLASTAELGADAAFEVHFGGRYDELDREIYAYLKRGQYQRILLKVPVPEPTIVAIEPANEAEVQQRLTALETAPREL